MVLLLNLFWKTFPRLSQGKKRFWFKLKLVVSIFQTSLSFKDFINSSLLLPSRQAAIFSGIVKEVGADVKHLKPGDEVFGLVVYGGFAEEVLIPANMCFLKPTMMGHKVAASFMMAYGTSYYALKDRAKLKAGESLLVLGASGGVGLAAVELGKQMGARVIAAASTDEKLALCKEHGADETINYTTEDLKKRAKELTGGKGVNVIYDPVGGAYSEAALRAIAWEGRFLVVGFPAGIAKIPLNLPLLKGCQIIGVFWGSFFMRSPQKNMQNTLEIIEMYKKKQLHPHIHAVYPLAEAPQALQEVMDRKVKGKIIIQP